MSVSRDELNRKLHEMVFVYNAVMNGWRVRRRSDGTLKFSKRRRNERKESISVDLNDDELRDFINDNVKVEDLFRNRCE